jgi:uncharacterized protein YtpQ (UPF0354 family)
MTVLRTRVCLFAFLASVFFIMSTKAAEFSPGEWEQKIRSPSLTPDQFTQLYAQFATANLTNAQVAVVGPLAITMESPDGGKWKFNLGNMWAEISKSPDDRPAICGHYLKSMAGLANRQPGVTGIADTNNLVPTIKSDAFVGQFRDGPAESGIVSEPFVADLNIVYASDREGLIALLTKKDQARLNLEFPALRNLAVTNLKRILQPVRERSMGSVFAISTGDGYSSSILLLDNFWDSKTNSVQGEIVAVVPARDVVLFTGSQSGEGVQQLQQIAEKIYAKGDHAVSKTLLVRRSGNWERFTH